MTERNEFSTTEIVKALGIPQERFREWLVRGYVKPSIREPKGPAQPAIWSHWDVYGVALFKKLLEGGISRENAAKILKTWEEVLVSPEYEDTKNLFFVICRYITKDDVSVLTFTAEHTDMFKNSFHLLGEALKYMVTGKLPGHGLTLLDKIGHRTPNWDDMMIINMAKIVHDVNLVLP
jgi:hypothetical protein